MERDFHDIGAEFIPVCSLNQLDSSSRMLDCEQGVLFTTYSALVEQVRSSIGIYQTGLKQLLKWCGVHFDGVIILDECHQVKDLFYRGSKSESLIEFAICDLQNEFAKRQDRLHLRHWSFRAPDYELHEPPGTLGSRDFIQR